MLHQYKEILVLILIFIQTSLFAQSIDTTIVKELDNVVISAAKLNNKTIGTPNATLKISMNLFNELPKILGNSDPIHYIQMLPGIQVSSEFDSGLHIQGCDNAHNNVSISGVPIYNVAHMFGLFSVFNASHFNNMLCTKSPYIASHANRLGGDICMQTQDSLQKKLSGNIEVGPISSQGTIKIPINKKTSIIFSARKAYLNLLYGFLLKIEDNSYKYDFSDYNFTYQYYPNNNNKIWIDAYYGNDRFGITDNASNLDTNLKWGNKMISAHSLSKTGDLKISQTLFLSQYNNKLTANQQSNYGLLQSSIESYGYKNEINIKSLSIGIDALYHNIYPQSIQGDYINIENNATRKKQNSYEFSLYGEYKKELCTSLILSSGVRLSNFISYDKKRFYTFDPSIKLSYYTNNGKFGFQYVRAHQFISQTGFTSMNMPTEFWYSSNDKHHPQNSHSFSTSYDLQFNKGKYSLSAEMYYKRLNNQEEYGSDIIQILTTPYNFDEIMIHGNGINYGINFMINKKNGIFTGWLSYSLSRSLRKFDNFIDRKYYPSNHERIHELNLVMSYSFSKNIQIGSTTVFATGTPFTSPKNFYMINNLLVTEYGEHNANRLKPYFRTDASLNYSLKKKSNFEHGFNISVYNLSYNKNDMYYRLKVYNNKFSYYPVRFFIKTIPSINYYIRF